MTAITTTAPTTTSTATAATTARRTRPVLRATGVSAVAGAAAATAFAAVTHAAGVPFEIDGEAIPVSGFAVLTVIGAIVGGVLLAALNRYSARPARRFVQVTAVLTAVSCVPSLTSPPDTASKLSLAAAHLIAAAVIVPLLVRTARADRS